MLKLPSSLVAAGLFTFAAMFLSPFAFVLTNAGYRMLKRGNFTFTPREGPVQIFSSTSHPEVFWCTSAGVSIVGVLLLMAIAVSLIIAIRILMRAWRLRLGNIM